jgi:hypothetical protein
MSITRVIASSRAAVWTLNMRPPEVVALARFKMLLRWLLNQPWAN